MAHISERDPLGDLYSDDSNDSFFEEPKKPTSTKQPDKKAITNVFGLDQEKSTNKNDWLGLDATEDVVQQKITKVEKPSKKISFDDDDDILNDLGFDKKIETAPQVAKDKSVSNSTITKTKSSLMESIFGPPKPVEKHDSLEDLLKESKTSQKINLSPSRTITNKPASNVGYDIGDFSREGRRSRHQSASSKPLDPLGLFSADTTSEPPKMEKPPIKFLQGEGDAGVAETERIYPIKTKDVKPKSAPAVRNVPDWLEGSPVKMHKSDTGIAKNKPQPEVAVQKNPPTEDGLKPLTDNADVVDHPTMASLITQQQLSSSYFDYQNTSVALQQQESQLLIALQLKKYEENLAHMQRKQQDVLIKQEQQFSHLLEKQFAKQQGMENNMRMQQERINNNIQLLLSQPTISGTLNSEEQEEIIQLKRSNAEENSRLYEEMISTLKQRQHEEIFLLNESYKKQINLLENSMEAVEARLKTEFTTLSDQYNKTINSLKSEHEDELTKSKEKLNEMSISHLNEIKQIRENHSRIIDEIKYEYSTMVENMKRVKETETFVTQNANTYTQKLDNSLEILDVNSKILNEIRGKVQGDYGVLSLAREESLKAKEEEIKMMRATLEKAREAADSDRAQLMSLVRTLELKLVEQTQDAKEERWSLQQAAAILTAKTSTFDREMEFARSALEREKEQIKTLKETMLAEQEKVLLQLTEEKLLISAEKSRIETTAKLSQNFESQRDRVEIDAAIQVAKEATERTDREREKLHKQQCEIESLKRNLSDRQHQLALKEKELQGLFANADRKAKDGDKALAEAKLLGNKYNERLRDIQSQLVSLTSREKKLAEEKIALSKERLSLHNNLKQIKKCRLCTADDVSKPDDNFIADTAEQDFSPRLLAMTDPDILRLRCEINEERSAVPREID